MSAWLHHFQKILSKKGDLHFLDLLIGKLNQYRRYRKRGIQHQEDMAWLSLFGDADHFEHLLEGGIKILLYKDSKLSRYIYGGFEEGEIQFLKKYLRKGDVFFDIGANIGLYSLTAAHVLEGTGAIHAFEPTPRIFERLVQNITINGYRNITANNTGLSDKAGYLPLNIYDDGHDAWNSFAYLSRLHLDSTIKVQVQQLDDYILANNINTEHIKLFKIDVEGWEKFVLEGAKEILSAPGPVVYIIEFTEVNTFSAGYMCQEIYETMVGYGFSWYRYLPEVNVLLEEEKKLNYPYDNLYAVKNREFVKRRLNGLTT